ncbi:MAG: AIG2 family protein [Rhodospirillaceae bacterium]|nr:MAG: AIG2 family protein [Rhodospirillaceae bacterium]
MTGSDTRHVFVYGTLRRGEVNDITRLQPAPRYLGIASIPGEMYHLGDYPGVVLGGSGRVQGEVFAIVAELEHQLDAIETIEPAHCSEYVRRQVELRVGDRTLQCLVYEVRPHCVRGRPRIVDGDWVRARRGHV